MITIEKFSFDHEDCPIIGASNGTDYHIEIVATKDDPIYIKLTFRGKKAFRKALETINDIGTGLLKEGPKT